MKLTRFKVQQYRNVENSGWIDINRITAFVGQNEAGKSNLFEALYRINPLLSNDGYNIEEDWPVQNWGERNEEQKVCSAEFELSDTEVVSLYEYSKKELAEEDDAADVSPPSEYKVTVEAYYNNTKKYTVTDTDGLDGPKITQWIQSTLPKIVLVHDYEMSGSQTELNQLKSRIDTQPWHQLDNNDQTIKIVLDLAKIDLDEFISKAGTAEGRTSRAYDKRIASQYLTKQFAELWGQKDVAFEIEVDGTTLNIFAVDKALGMPVRLARRSTGFRWYVSFAWKFTHASSGEYKDCILLLEEPGVHLHYDGQKDLLEVFERLSKSNTVLYTTHLSSMVDLGFPERVRIVENSDGKATVNHGIISNQSGPMAVVEKSLGLTDDLSGILANRKTLIVEGGDDAMILYKLSAVLKASEKPHLPEDVYLWAAEGASKTPMYAAFAIGQRWDAGVLLDTDEAGLVAKKKIDELLIKEQAECTDLKFRTLMLGESAGIKATDAAIEDLFPVKFYLGCVNESYGLAIKDEDLPEDGSTLITKRVEYVLKNRFGKSKLDKRLVFNRILEHFATWSVVKDLPTGTAVKAEKLFKKIAIVFEQIE